MLDELCWNNLKVVVDEYRFRDVECVVYVVRNVKNQKLYIGKTKGRLSNRLRSHVACHLNSRFPFYKALKKYGINNFEAAVLYQGTSDKEISDVEIKMIDRFQTSVFEGKGYNVLGGGENSRPYSKKTRKKISDAKKGVPLSNEARQTIMKPVMQFDLVTGELLKQFRSIGEAMQKTKIVNIGKCCRGELPHAGGFTWKYVNEQDVHKGLWTKKKRELMSKRMLIDNPNNHPVEMLDIDGNLLKTFVSIKTAIDETQVKNISSVCRGVRKTAGGFRWRYKPV